MHCVTVVRTRQYWTYCNALAYGYSTAQRDVQANPIFRLAAESMEKVLETPC